jgi:hypothetical protein
MSFTGGLRRYWALCTFLVCTTLFPLPAGSQIIQNNPVVNMGWLHGTVLDDHDQPAGGGEVELVSRENEFTAAVGPDGKFTLRVPPDIYSIRVRRPDAFLYQRSVLFIGAFDDVHLNVRPVYHAALAPGSSETSIHYFSFTGPGRMQYGAVLRSLDVRAVPDGKQSMMLTYDKLAVYARLITCDRRTFICTAEGSPAVELGSPSGVRVARPARVEIDMAKRMVFLYTEDAVEDVEF